MAKPVQDITFTGWLEDIFKTVPGFPKKTIAAYWDSKRRKYFIVKVASSSNTSDPKGFEAYYFSQSAETLRDIKGINTVVNLENFTKQPFETLRKLGQQTVDDIRNIDEAGSDRLANTVEELVAGNTSRKNKSDLRTPDNMILWTAQKLGVGMTDTNGVIDSSGGTPKSKIQMIGSSIVGFGPSTEDRKVLEEGEDENRAYKSYKALGASLAGVAGYVESTGTRGFYYNAALTEYNRSIANELGVNLTNTLPTQRYHIGSPAKVESALFDELKAGRPGFLGPGGSVKNLEDLVSDPTRMQRALGINITVLDPKTQEFLRGFVRSEVYQSIGIAPSYARDPKKNSFTGKYVEPAGPPGSALAGTMVFDPNDIITLKGKIIQKGFVDKDDFVAEVISNEATKQSILTQMQLRNAMAEVNADLTRIFEERAVAEFNAHQLGLGLAPVAGFAHLPPAAQRNAMGKADRARDRIDSATRAMDLASKLQYYGSTRDLLNAIEEGNFLNLAFVSSRFFGLLPLADSEFGFLKHITAPIDKFADIYETKLITPLKNTVVGKLGLTYDPNAKTFFGKKVGKGLLTSEGIVNLEWDEVQTIGVKKIIHSHQVFVKTSEGKGLFGAFSSTDIAKKILGNGSQSAIHSDVLALGFPGLPAHFADFNNLFSPSGGMGSALNVENLMGQLATAADEIITGHATGATGVYHALAEALGLTPQNNAGVYLRDNLNLLNAQIAEMSTHGRQLMQKMDALGLPASSRWEFLSGIIKQGKNGQFTNEFMGILERYNRYANAINSFLYKQILWGQYGGTNALIHGMMKITAPMRALLRGIGFSDGWSLSQWVENRFIMRVSTVTGNKLMQIAGGQAVTTVLKSKLLAGVLGGMARSKIAAALIRSVGLLLANGSAIATAGLSYVLMAFSDVAWAFFKNLFKLDFDKAAAEVKQILIKKFNTVKKIVWTLTCSILACISIPIVLVILLVVMIMAPIEGMGGGAHEDLIESKNLKVVKTGSVDEANKKIIYQLKITNISKDSSGNGVPLKITGMRDRITYTESCNPDGTSLAHEITTATSPWGNIWVNAGGTWAIKVPDPTMDFPNNGQLQADESITFIYELRDILTTNSDGTVKNGTYVNSVELIEDSTPDRPAFGTVSNNIGDGGCNVCPAGWPTSRGVVTQGRKGSHSHTVAQAIDIDGDPNIISTHNGTVIYTQDNVVNGCQQKEDDMLEFCAQATPAQELECIDMQEAYYGSNCAYGTMVKIQGASGYVSLFAHLSSLDLKVGDSVEQGNSIGIMGNTGNSTAVHLHYEFLRNNAMCKGYVVQMENVEGESFIPVTVDSCGGKAPQPACTVRWPE